MYRLPIPFVHRPYLTPVCLDGHGRHRLGVADHLALRVGEARRPGPIDDETAAIYEDMLDLPPSEVSWGTGMSNKRAQELLRQWKEQRTGDDTVQDQAPRFVSTDRQETSVVTQAPDTEEDMDEETAANFEDLLRL